MDTQQGLAERVAALRQRLDQMEPAAGPSRLGEPPPEVKRLQQVCQQLAQVHRLHDQIDGPLSELLIRQEMEPTGGQLPAQLTWRTRRLLLRGRDLLERLRGLSSELLPERDEEDPIWTLYRQTLAMAELALRSVQTFPPATAEQLRLCAGLEGSVDVVEQRTVGLTALLARQRTETEHVESLAHSLVCLANGRPVLLKPLQELAETIIQEAHASRPMRWVKPCAARPEQWAAAQCLNTAQVMARLARHDAEWRGGMAEAVLVALVHDVGMATMPAELLSQAGPLSEEQRRLIEAHVGLSAEGVRRLAPAEGWLTDVVRAHHERQDGTGYPTGAMGQRIPRLARLLAVCDVYAALASPRAHRPALSPRGALTETLLEAEKGRLDADLAQHLLEISFYPVGTVVELSDGQLGVVVATNPPRTDLAAPARPVVQVLVNEEGKPLPWAEHVNLAQCEGRHVVRSLTTEEGRSLLGARYWHLL